MERPLSPDPRHDRIARATTRVNAAMAQVSEAQEVLTEAKERLALARLAREHATVRGVHDLPKTAAPERSWRDEDDPGAARGER